MHTSAGIYDAARVVNAAGAWAPRFQRLPMKAMGLHVNVTEPRARLLEPMIQHIGRRLTLKQAYNGTFIIGGGWPSREAPGRWATSWESAAGNAAVAVDVVPALADVRLAAHLVGRDRVDRRRLADPRESEVPGLYTIVVGSSGYTLSPLFARMLAEQITSGTPPPIGVSDPTREDPGMNRDTVDWRGYFAAVPTPFNEDGSLALDLLRELLDFYVDQGLHGVLVLGTTGEWFSQSTQERRLVAETAIDAIGGRIPVLIGCTDYTADLVIAHARHAFDAGAAGVTSTPPPYAKPFDDEIVAFYEDIARASRTCR